MRDKLAHAAEPASGAPADGVRLTGAPLALARAAWLVTTLVSLGLLVAAMPLAYQQIITPQTGPQCADSRLSAAQLGALHAAHISPAFFAGWIIAVQCYETLVYVGVGALLFWRRSDNRMALLAATSLALMDLGIGDTHWLGAECALRPAWPAAALLFDLLGVLASLLVPVLFYTFPSGRWVPRWIGWLMLAWLPLSVPSTLLRTPMNDFLAAHLGVGNAIAGLLYATFPFAQVYRYWRVSTPAERLQTKWVVLGGGIDMGVTAAIVGWGAFGGYNPGAPWWPVQVFYLGSVIQFSSTLLPISIGIALLRSRLFDVDQIINRVLVYGSLTGVLGALYVGVVIALQHLTGQTQPLLVVLSTLVIALLVQPLRRALQRGIDRRFYRRKYDAARTLAAFSATLRDEVDLTRLCEDLLAVVDETMQPQHLWLWLPDAPLAPTSEPAADE